MTLSDLLYANKVQSSPVQFT